MSNTAQGTDYAALFAATPSPYLVLTPELFMCDVNRAYVEVCGRERDELLGRYIFDVFPDNPADPDADGVRNLRASLQRVLATGEPDTMALQRYDVAVPGTDEFEERYWSPVNTPVLDSNGAVVRIIHRPEEVTAFVLQRRQEQQNRQLSDDLRARAEGMEAELFTRARELQRINERLREANAREHEVALTLQHAMLPETVPSIPGGLAVRYLPAVQGLSVCGDWYDVADVHHGRYAAAVGDVVGRGLEAAAVMGQLRSALSALIRASFDGPARALDVLDVYARSIDRATGTTVVKVVIDTSECTLTYSCAGHLPPMLAHPDGTVELLDQATDAPLAARPEPIARPQARTTFASGSTLVLYTDGLIERRGEDLDTGLTRLSHSITRHIHLDPDKLDDALLADLDTGHNPIDDTALVVIRL